MNADRELEYDIDVDYAEWLPVPLEFPWNGYADAGSWAAEVAGTLGERLDSPPDVVEAIGDTARTVATVEGPFPGAIERFWFVDGPDHPVSVAHLYVAEYPDAGEPAARSVATAGIGGYVQVVEPLEGTAFSSAAKTVVLSQPDDPDTSPVVLARFIGFSQGFAFIAEVVDDDRTALWLVLDPLERLFRSIRLRDGDG